MIDDTMFWLPFMWQWKTLGHHRIATKFFLSPHKWKLKRFGHYRIGDQILVIVGLVTEYFQSS
jgi:hypothetical protein